MKPVKKISVYPILKSVLKTAAVILISSLGAGLTLKSPVFMLTLILRDYCINNSDEPVITHRLDKLHYFHFHDKAAGKKHLPFGGGEINLQNYLRLALQCDARMVL